MRFQIIWVGRAGESFVADACAHFINKIAPMAVLEVTEIKQAKGGKATSKILLQQQEYDSWKPLVKKGAQLCLLHEGGKLHTSRTWANTLELPFSQGHPWITFVIGGPFGHCPLALQSANVLLSLSPMTFSHDVIRVCFLEQLYRACTLVKGIPYHHD